MYKSSNTNVHIYLLYSLNRISSSDSLSYCNTVFVIIINFWLGSVNSCITNIEMKKTIGKQDSMRMKMKKKIKRKKTACYKKIVGKWICTFVVCILVWYSPIFRLKKFVLTIYFHVFFCCHNSISLFTFARQVLRSVSCTKIAELPCLELVISLHSNDDRITTPLVAWLTNTGVKKKKTDERVKEIPIRIHFNMCELSIIRRQERN